MISDAKGNGLDDNDAAGIFLSNAGQVTVTDMILDNNEFGCAGCQHRKSNRHG